MRTWSPELGRRNEARGRSVSHGCYVQLELIVCSVPSRVVARGLGCEGGAPRTAVGSFADSHSHAKAEERFPGSGRGLYVNNVHAKTVGIVNV